ncbi:MAG TPA: hypothetical protein VH253_11560 [Phycisphaerae bacterium]|nr:hypothetical protein [Phycisphaerae bacterium]
MTITLPEHLKDWLGEQASREGFPSPDAYVADILLRTRQLTTREQIDARLAEALASGDSRPMTDADWQRLRETARSLRKGPA